MSEITRPGQLRIVIPADQIQKRVREMGRQIRKDFPDDPIPEHESLPFDRDEYLPKPHRF